MCWFLFDFESQEMVFGYMQIGWVLEAPFDLVDILLMAR